MLYKKLKEFNIHYNASPQKGAIYIMPSGEFLSIENNRRQLNIPYNEKPTHPHLDFFIMDNNLLDVNEPGSRALCYSDNAIRCNDGSNLKDEIIISLPEDKLTEDQYESLLDWLYSIMNYCKFVEVGSESDFSIYNKYYFKEYIPEDIIKEIKFYYNKKKVPVMENIDNMDDEIVYIDDYCIGDYIEQDIYQYKKLDHILDELGIDETNKLSKTSPMFILPNGNIIDIEKANSQIGINNRGYDTHQDFLYDIFKKLFQNKYGEDGVELDLMYGINEYQMDIFTEQYNLIRINPGNNMVEGRFYCVLPRSSRPTESQFNTLRDFFDLAYEMNKNEVLVVITYGFQYKKYSLIDNTADDVVKKCKRFYGSNSLVESQADYFKNSKIRDEEGNLLVCYHGTPNPGFTKFNPREAKSQFGDYKFEKYNVNYFTTNLKTAQGYTELGIGDVDGQYKNIYACYLNITNPYIVDFDTEEDMRRAWNNIKDKKIREKELNAFKKFWNKWSDLFLDEDDLEEINRELFYFNRKIIPASERKENSGYSKDEGYYDLYDLGNNTKWGNKHVVLYCYELEEMFDSSMYEEMRDAIVGDFENYPDDFKYTIDNLIKFVILMNEEDGTNYDGIIISDISDIGPHGSMFDENTTDIVTLISSNQIKRITNINPTDSDDIDESLTLEEEQGKAQTYENRKLKTTIFKKTGWKPSDRLVLHHIDNTKDKLTNLKPSNYKNLILIPFDYTDNGIKFNQNTLHSYVHQVLKGKKDRNIVYDNQPCYIVRSIDDNNNCLNLYTYKISDIFDNEI